MESSAITHKTAVAFQAPRGTAGSRSASAHRVEAVGGAATGPDLRSGPRRTRGCGGWSDRGCGRV